MRTDLLSIFGLMLVSTAIVAMPAVAQNALGLGGSDDRHAEVDLVVADTTVRPGGELRVGVRFRLDDDWHVYWQNPGDAGTPPDFRFSLPDGWTAGDVRYPAPSKFEQGGLVGYGYAKEVVFPVTLKVPATALPGRDARIVLAADYLICDDERCVPEKATALTTVSVGMMAQSDAEGAATLDEAEARVPVEPPVGSARVLSASLDEVVVRLPEDATDADLFPLPPSNVLATPGPAISTPEGTITFDLETRGLGGATVGAFPAVVAYTDGEGRRRGLRLTLSPQ